MADRPLNQRDAGELVRLIQAGEVSVSEVMAAHLAQIDAHNEQVNAICTLRDRAEIAEDVAALERRLASGDADGPLVGLPIAIKDLALTAGIRTTMGSPIFEHFVPKEDALFVQRIKAAGAIVIGKTNTPEFGAGSQTFNPLFGATKNPWNLCKTVGGSSGGAAAALASRMLPIADGSDMGGSLRNPAAFCGVVGFRPSIGRVPSVPGLMAWQSRLGVEGPMARNVEDCARLLGVMAGPDVRDPLSLPELEVAAPRDPSTLRIGWTEDAGLPVEQAVRAGLSQARAAFESLGCEVTGEAPDFSGAMDVFRVLRANHFSGSTRDTYPSRKDQMKDTMIANIEVGRALSGVDLTNADRQRTQIYQRMVRFFEHHDFLVMPTTQVVPFDVTTEWVREIEGVAMTDYIDWMTICCIVTVTGLPAISLPCGFTAHGLPIGLQLSGPPRGDAQLLAFARQLETALAVPSLPKLVA